MEVILDVQFGGSLFMGDIEKYIEIFDVFDCYINKREES